MESFWETQLQQLNAEHKRLMDEVRHSRPTSNTFDFFTIQIFPYLLYAAALKISSFSYPQRVILSLEIGKLHSEFAKHKQEAAELAEWKSRANAENGTVSYLTRRLELLEHELKEERARSLALRRASGPEAGPSAEKQRPGRASLDDAPEFKLQLDPVGISKWATLTAPIPVHGVLPVKCDEGEAYLVIARDSNGLFERDTVVFEGETLTPAEFLRRMGHQRVPTWQTALRVKMEDGSEMSVFDWEEKRSCGLVCGNKVIFVVRQKFSTNDGHNFLFSYVPFSFYSSRNCSQINRFARPHTFSLSPPIKKERTRRGPPRAVTPPSTDAPPPAPLDSPTARRRAHTNALPAADPVRSSPRLRNSAGAGPTPTARPPTTKTARALSLAPKRKRREDGAEGCAAPAVAGAGGGPAETCAICWVDLPAAVNTKSGRRREAAALEAARKSSAPDLTAVSKLQCAHRFHRSCIQKWIDKCNTCPTCRKEVAEFEGKPLHARNALADDGGALGAVVRRYVTVSITFLGP